MAKLWVPGHFDIHFQPETGPLEQSTSRFIIGPHVGAKPRETSSFRLIRRPFHQPPANSLPPLLRTNRDSVHQKAVPILHLIDRIEYKHPVFRKQIALLIAQPCGGIRIDHAYDTRPLGNETMAPAEATALLLKGSRHEPCEHLSRRQIFEQKFIHAVTRHNRQLSKGIGVGRHSWAKDNLWTLHLPLPRRASINLSLQHLLEGFMPVVIAMLRGINVGGNQKIQMETLRKLCTSLGLQDVQTYIQSGNLVFRMSKGEPSALARKLEDAIERDFGFRPAVVVRTVPELRQVVAANPFAEQAGIEPSRLLVVFMAAAPDRKAREQVLAMPCEPEELRIEGRELYIYYPNGMARPKIPFARIEKLLQTPSTGRNWNTVTKLMAMAEVLEGAG